jgi:aspartyl/asparaginyl-tRNA synthetase
MAQIPISSYCTLKTYHQTVTKLRRFFFDRGFLEVDTQSRRSILAACEQPETVATYTFAGVKWPLPQTGQMWLEYELLKNPEVPGVFCSTTSYRDEPRPIPERHLTIFPMLEFESHGDMTALQKLLEDLCEALGFGNKEIFAEGEYTLLAQQFQTRTIESEHELQLWKKFSHVFFLKNFPTYTSPFFNMKRMDGYSKKIDLLLYGMETIGSAERSCNADEMREEFHTISEGKYAQLLFDHFTKERVEKELEEFLSFDFFPRFGGGIGVNRMIRALTLRQQELAVEESRETGQIAFATMTTQPQQNQRQVFV